MSRIAIIIPTLDEEAVLEGTVRTLTSALPSLEGHDAVIRIVDNGSVDATPEIGHRLAEELAHVRYMDIGKKGKGRAIRAGWESEDADVYAFMDADLATDLGALPALVEGVLNENGIAYGSRFHRDADVDRSVARLVFSHGYRLATRALLNTRIGDAPCGFKAVSRSIVADVLPDVRDLGWFFDTELAVRAERRGYPLVEVPVKWQEHEVDGRRSKVNPARLAVQYLDRLIDLRKELS